ncbi:hypothetical protein SAMD00019534_041410 [Acytostelium subglobosum LB1]|uniref:hypothetical protein n=1 Tax=Acytostelium subglobosum LB1 TaxID=1410327 RepID=UPI0006447BA1|nr:hypothetical protein SAMD00019534_041410 [Acytostelium subglobosum LB1]GAM20966.1 hypothetical protein SAMD00019534_041410 [Acytostelium subglobosum LB1]|eukprot:XP_012756100.1 hypothetical protein SAMD00019534_041410 [Acytostelium subglobosum LB1]
MDVSLDDFIKEKRAAAKASKLSLSSSSSSISSSIIKKKTTTEMIGQSLDEVIRAKRAKRSDHHHRNNNINININNKSNISKHTKYDDNSKGYHVKKSYTGFKNLKNTTITTTITKTHSSGARQVELDGSLYITINNEQAYDRPQLSRLRVRRGSNDGVMGSITTNSRGVRVYNGASGSGSGSNGNRGSGSRTYHNKSTSSSSSSLLSSRRQRHINININGRGRRSNDRDEKVDHGRGPHKNNIGLIKKKRLLSSQIDHSLFDPRGIRDYGSASKNANVNGELDDEDDDDSWAILRLKNLPDDVVQSDIGRLFTNFGPLKDFELLDYARPKEAIVTFRRRLDAMMAKERFNNTWIGDNKLEIELIMDDDDEDYDDHHEQDNDDQDQDRMNGN